MLSCITFKISTIYIQLPTNKFSDLANLIGLLKLVAPVKIGEGKLLVRETEKHTYLFFVFDGFYFLPVFTCLC